jgi:cytochrome c553
MFAELERCARCHQRYPEPLGHRCPQASFAEQREQEFERQLADWLDTPEGRFAAFLARRQRPV